MSDRPVEPDGRVRFTAADQNRAFAEWGANCGPGAIAAIVGLTLDDVRPLLGDFERKHYTNPSLMWAILDRLGLRWRKIIRPQSWPKYGLVRVQWEGAWTAPGVPIAAAYRHTHWVGANAKNPENVGIFDINAIGNGTGWVSVFDWAGTIVPFILANCEPHASGRWHLTHAAEIEDVRCTVAD